MRYGIFKFLLGGIALTALVVLADVVEAFKIFFAVVGIPLMALASIGLISDGVIDMFNNIPERWVEDLNKRVDKVKAELEA